jgi:predicted nucleic acid-binding protein
MAVAIRKARTTMLVVDASVALKFVTAEPGIEAAAELLKAPDPLIAPDWLLVECANGLAKKVLNNRLPQTEASASLVALPEFFARLHPTIALLDSSFALSLRIGHPLYDCLYLALALREGATVITADLKFETAARRSGFGAQVRLLGSDR